MTNKNPSRPAKAPTGTSALTKAVRELREEAAAQREWFNDVIGQLQARITGLEQEVFIKPSQAFADEQAARAGDPPPGS